MLMGDVRGGSTERTQIVNREKKGYDAREERKARAGAHWAADPKGGARAGAAGIEPEPTV